MLNTEQKKAYDMMINTSKSFILAGSGGTGKTYTLAQALPELEKRHKNNIAICAPTHSAAKVIRDSLKDLGLNPYLYHITTIHSLLGQFATINYYGEEEFGLPTKLAEYSLVIIDELSAVNAIQHQTLEESDCRIIGMGDLCQLPPVMSKVGCLWDNLPIVELKQQMRNGGSILEAANQCRVKEYYPTRSSDNLKVHKDVDAIVNEFVGRIRDAEDPTEFVFLAYRNKTVKRVANLVHRTLYGSKDYVEGQYIRLTHNDIGRGIYNGLITTIGSVSRSNVDGVSVYSLGLFDDPVFVNVPRDLSEYNERLAELKAEIVDLVDGKAKRAMIKGAINNLQKFRKAVVLVESPFSLTVHKSQGMSIPYVFVESTDLKTANAHKKNLLYVAYSRAKKELHTVVIPESKVSKRQRFKTLKGMLDVVYETKDSFGQLYPDIQTNTKDGLIKAINTMVNDLERSGVEVNDRLKIADWEY